MRTTVTLFFLLSFASLHAVAEDSSAVVVLQEPGFPAADSATPSQLELSRLLPGAHFASTEQLRAALSAPVSRLLVLPYGSAFPEAAWPEIHSFLQRGGNLLALGGQPFTRAAYGNAEGWHLRDYSVRFTRELFIDQYQATPGSDGLEFQTNPDLVLQVPRFMWKRAFSPIIRLSASDVYSREGSAGSLDARLDALAWGTKDNRRIAAPLLQIDHLRNRFAGGRWIFLNAELPPDFYGSAGAARLIPGLTQAALSGSEEFTVRPVLPLYLPGEPIEIAISWYAAMHPAGKLTARITLFPESKPSSRAVIVTSVPASQPVVLEPTHTKGFHIIEAELLEGKRVRAVYRSGFWIRDEAYLGSGPRLVANHDYFELDGRPLAVAGTTYMASDVQRLFFEHPNLYIWDRDLGQIKTAGLNMIRTGWWTGWDKFCDENGQPYERTLRTLEAFLMTARKHDLPVQFNFFAFLPEVLGGVNAYLDPETVHKQQRLISSVVERFHDVPFLAWDLINEPSFSQHLWQTRPNGDSVEIESWNQWLRQHYSDHTALTHAWNMPSGATDGVLPLPAEPEFMPRGVYAGHNSLKLYDYYLFAQESFAAWVEQMRNAIRATGSQQLITVGQDEGGYEDRLTPAYFGKFVDFTANHSWWENDSLLWDSLVAKQPGMPMLIQETGLQRELSLDEIARRTAESEAALLERKLAMSLVQGSGAIQWLWYANAYMTQSNEAPIGAVRADLTEKPEAAVMREFARFAKAAQETFHNPQQPQVAIVTSQVAQFSVIQDLQLRAQQKAVRVMAYAAHVPAYMIAENQIDKLGSPKLAILPSAQALSETAWHSLLNYVSGGGNLLITGSVARDEHWHAVQRGAELQLDDVQIEPVTYRYAEIPVGNKQLSLLFDQQAQSWLESARFKDGAKLKQISLGKGHIFWAAYPIELSEGLQATADLYSYVLTQLGIQPLFDLKSKLSPGVLVYPTVLDEAVLYTVLSESADDADIDIVDKLTGTRLQLRLPSQHAAIVMIRRSDGAIVARYGL